MGDFDDDMSEFEDEIIFLQEDEDEENELVDYANKLRETGLRISSQEKEIKDKDGE